jgi:gliding motility-associated-like protein
VVPNIITPNGDGHNDVWTLKFAHLYPDIEVAIYDRNGKEVYFSKGYKAPWKGQYLGGALSTAAFYYVIDFNMANKENATGVINLIK